MTRQWLSPAYPLEVLNTLTLTEHLAGTRMTIMRYPIDVSEEERKTFEPGHKSIQQGFSGTLDQLAAHLAEV